LMIHSIKLLFTTKEALRNSKIISLNHIAQLKTPFLETKLKLLGGCS
jgi:hypothetical protein